MPVALAPFVSIWKVVINVNARKGTTAMREQLDAKILMNAHDCRAAEMHCVATMKAASNAPVPKASSAIQ